MSTAPIRRNNSRIGSRLPSWLSAMSRGRERRQRRNQASDATVGAVESLEDRVLLSELIEMTTPKSFAVDGHSQFSEGQAIVLDEHISLVEKFDTGKHTIGGFVDVLGVRTGAQASVRLHGQAGFNFGFFVNSGSVNAEYDTELSQSYVDPTSFGTVQLNTALDVDHGAFSTVSPTLGGYAELIFKLGGLVELEAYLAGAGGKVGGPFTAADIHHELFAFNRDNDRQIRIHGESISENPDFQYEISVPVSKAPPVNIDVTASPLENQLGFQQELGVTLGIKGKPQKPKKVEKRKEPEFELPTPSAGVTVRVGTMTQSLPFIELEDRFVDVNGQLSASSQYHDGTQLADIGLEFAKLIHPAVSPAFGKTTLKASIGSTTLASLSVTPISFLAGPRVFAHQNAEVAPFSELTYEFDRPVMVQLEPGGPFVSRQEIRFAPGDFVNINFQGEPVVVTPRWDFGIEFHNDIDFDVALGGKLEVGVISVDVFSPQPVKDFVGWPATIGPLHEERFLSSDVTSVNIFDERFLILQESIALKPFVIGEDFAPNTLVTSTADMVSGSLRGAIRSANTIDSNDAGNSETNVIVLGEGTYRLTTKDIPSLPDAEDGDLDVFDRDLRIIGAGAGKTIIDATGLNSRVFEVHAGASLTLEGVTIIGGNAASNEDGGGVHNSGTLTVIDSEFRDNNARYGGAIANFGQLLVEDTTLDKNSADVSGGAFFNDQGATTIRRSTLSRNTAVNNAGGIYFEAGTIAVESSTISGNTANAGAGAYGINGGNVSILQSTITDNHANILGGGVRFRNLNLVIGNTILAGNTAPAAKGPDGFLNSVNVTDLGYNLVGNNSNVGLSSNVAGNLINRNPELQPLGHYGGPTQTHIPKAGSVVNDAGNAAIAATRDQRGFPIGADGSIDIGAVQYLASTLSVQPAGAVSLRDAIAAYNGQGGSNTIHLAPGTYTLAGAGSGPDNVSFGDLDVIGQTLLIVGSGPGATIIDGSDIDDRVFEVHPNADLSISRVKVTGGTTTDHGGGFYNAGVLTIGESIISGNEAQWGGGVYSEGAFKIFTSVLVDNIARGQNGGTTFGGGGGGGAGLGGGVFVADGEALVQSTTLSGNLAIGGNGGNGWRPGKPGGVGGGPNGGAGGVDIKNFFSFYNFPEGPEPGDDGGFGSGGGGASSFASDNIFTSGFGYVTIAFGADGGAGGFGAGGGGGGGGSGFVYQANFSPGDGGAPGFGGGEGGGGRIGALDASGGGGGGGGGIGGALFHMGGDVNIIDSTITDNAAHGGVGGLSTDGIRGGAGEGVAGGVFGNDELGRTITVKNSVVAENNSNLGTDVYGAFDSAGSNLIGDTTGATGFGNADLGGTVTKPIDPMLEPLANNGGPTPTHQPMPFSPVIDGGRSNLVIDQRGFGRLFGSQADIGAIEYNVTLPPIPILNGPTGTVASTRPTITWDISADSIAYELWLYENGREILRVTDLSLPEFTPGDLKAGAHYVAHVRGVKPGGDTTPFSPGLQFHIEAPPAPRGTPNWTNGGGQTADLTPAFAWSDVDGADVYEYLMYNLNAGKLIADGKVINSFASATEDLDPGEYLVYSRAANAGGVGPWSSGLNIQVGETLPQPPSAAPQWVSPGSSTSDTTPTLSWNAVTNATDYDVLFYDADAGKELANFSEENTSWTPDTPLGSGNYVAYVRAANAGGAGPWSARNFTVIGGLPNKPVVTGPLGTISDTTPTITWNASASAASYNLLAYSVNRGAEVVNVANIKRTDLTTPALVGGETYSVYVQANLTGGGTSGYSQPLMFAIEGQRLSAPTFLSPGATTSNTKPEYTWTDEGADRYEFQLYDALAGQQIRAFTTDRTQVILPVVLKNDGKYSAYVRSLSDDGRVSEWNVLNFTVSSGASAAASAELNSPLDGVFSELALTGIV